MLLRLRRCPTQRKRDNDGKPHPFSIPDPSALRRAGPEFIEGTALRFPMVGLKIEKSNTK